MHDLAELVTVDRVSARTGSLVRVVAVTGLGGEGAGGACVLTPRGRGGRVLRGVADHLLERLGPGVSTVTVEDEAAHRAGLTCGGTARVLLQPLADVPDLVWEVLAAREALCLVTDLSGPRVGRTTWFTLETLATGHDAAVGGGAGRHGPDVVARFGRGAGSATVHRLGDGTEVLVHALWPVPRLLVLGGGPVAADLVRLAGAVGWHALAVTDAVAAEQVVCRYTPGDAAVAATHGGADATRFLAAALGRSVGYVAAVGPPVAQQQVRADLLRAGVPAAVVEGVRGPAGLDLGGHTAAEVALAVLAEAVAVRNGADARPLRDCTRPTRRTSR